MIVIYGHQRCGYCKRAKKLAEQYHLKYEWRDTDEEDTLNQMKIMLPNAKTVPQIWIYGKHIGGYEDLVTELENTMGNYGQERF